MSTRSAYLSAAFAGVVLWMITAQLTGRREAWDAGEYWLLAYPLGIVCAGALAFFAPHPGAWRLGLVLMLGQAAALAVTTLSFGLLPIGLLLFVLLAIPPAAVATIASVVARQLGKAPGE